LTSYPQILNLNNSFSKHFDNDWNYLYQSLQLDSSVPKVTWIKPGQKEAYKMLNKFKNDSLENYEKHSNKPEFVSLSNMSPYLHFGHISAQYIALNIPNKYKSYLEELIIRRELADNFCYYQKDYDKFDAFPKWAQETLKKHTKDSRPYVYSLTQFENSKTHDPLWNAAMTEMVKFGKMHGYMRMYWAKKILHWSKHPYEALKITQYLNDKYFLDGRDPNGYTNIAWSIGGVHDHGWTEREVFGKIRSMTFASTSKKFNYKKYIERVII
jgi:deoxyribodipyrimidine photo-lyase